MMCRLFAVLLLLLQLSVSGQISTPLIVYNTASGLPSNEVYEVEQDENGFIWIATDHGIAKYDGYKFETFTTDDGLVDNTILKIFPDHQNRLWFVGLNNLLCYYENGKIFKYEHNAMLKDLFKTKHKGSYLRKMVVDSINRVYFTLRTKRDVIYCISETGIQEVNGSEGFSTIENFSVYSPPHFYGDYLCKILDSEKEPIIKDRVKPLTTFFKLKNGNAVTSNEKTTKFLTTQKEIEATHSLYNFHRMYEDLNGHIWYLTEEKVLKQYDYKNQKWLAIPENLKGRQINDVLQDPEGNYWFADQENGLLKVGKLAISQILSNSTSNKFVALSKFKKSLYALNSDGRLLHISEQGIQQEIHLPMGFREQRNVLDFSIVAENVFIASSNSILFELNSKVTPTPVVAACKVVEVDNNSVYVGTSTGVFKLNKNSHIQEHVGDSSFRPRTNAILIDRDNRLLIGTTEGLYLEKNNKFRRTEISALQNIRIMDIKQRDGLLCFATRGKGIICKRNDSVFTINSRNGLISNLAEKICFENDTVFWVGCRTGLSRVLIRKNAAVDVMNFNVTNGLPSNEINDVIYFKNRIWLATSKGVVHFNTNNLLRNRIEPKLSFLRILVNGRTKNYSAFKELKNNENNLQFDYVGISHSAGKNVKYMYRLLGLDNSWRTIKRKSLQFTNLKYGSYSLELKAANDHNVWSKEALKFDFRIKKKIAQTNLFKILFFLFCAGAIVGLIWWYNRSQKRKYLLQTRISELQQLALTRSMNPHFIFNALNAVQSNIYQGKLDDADRMLVGFSRLIRMNLQARIDPMIAIDESFQKLELYLKTEKIRIGDRLNFSIEMDQSVDPKLEIPSMILQPFVENAIWHGILPADDDGYVKILAERQGPKLIINIEDNGVGLYYKMAKVNKHISFSTKMTRERLGLLSKSTGKPHIVKIEDKADLGLEENGVLVTFELPV